MDKGHLPNPVEGQRKRQNSRLVAQVPADSQGFRSSDEQIIVHAHFAGIFTHFSGIIDGDTYYYNAVSYISPMNSA